MSLRTDPSPVAHRDQALDSVFQCSHFKNSKDDTICVYIAGQFSFF